jgi:hypothetical protein
MAFRKTGIAPIQKILCGCGAPLDSQLDKCPKCGKEIINPALREPPQDKTENSQVK